MRCSSTENEYGGVASLLERISRLYYGMLIAEGHSLDIMI